VIQYSVTALGLLDCPLARAMTEEGSVVTNNFGRNHDGCGRLDQGNFVIAGLVPAIPLR
jgi:hypothetical protein